MRESTFWKLLAWVLGGLLAGLVVIDALGVLAVPAQPKVFLFSCLFCMAVGYSIVSPKSSPVMLDDAAERTFRKKQLVVGAIFSVALGALLLVPEVHESSVSWILVPVIALAPVLIVREVIARARKQSR